MNIALVGATGLVGSVMLKVLEERNFPVNKLIPVASEKSIGRKIMFKGKECVIQCIESALLQHCDIAVFSAGSKVSLLYAPRFARKGCFVIDNS